MKSVFLDFATRSKEVQGYFNFVLRLSADVELLKKMQDGDVKVTPRDNDELLKTLKATCYLLLYNLVESTMRNAIEAIFDELKMTQASYDLCRHELKKEILSNFKKRSTDKLLPKLLLLARDVTHETFDRGEIFSGNIDAREIRLTAKRFGFAEPAGCQFQLLQTVKNARNDLAHGVKSFAEVGRDAASSDLDEARKQTVDILKQTLNNIDTYLKEKHYLVVPPVYGSGS